MIHVPLLLPVVGTTLKNGLVSVWELNETSGTDVFDAHGSNDGVNNGATVNQVGVTNLTPCYEFNASDYITMGNVLNFDTSDPFSYSFWVNMDTVSNQFFINKQLNSPDFSGYGCYYVSSLTELRVELINDNSPNYQASNRYIKTLNTGTWYHIIFTYDGGGLSTSIKTYVDLIELTPNTSVNTLGGRSITSSAPFLISSRGNGSVFPVSGLMDQTAAWNRVLISEERIALNNSTNGLAYINW